MTECPCGCGWKFSGKPTTLVGRLAPIVIGTILGWLILYATGAWHWGCAQLLTP